MIRAIALALCAAAVTTVLFHRLRLPVVLGYILAGLIVGPHVPIPLFAEEGTIHAFSELGVVLLMFSLGLDFSLRRLFQVGPTAGLTAVIQSSIMVWIGFMVGRAFGWTVIESVYCGAIIAISSTTIIAKAFDEQGVRGRLRDLVVGVLIVEDLIAILLMALLTAVSSGDGMSLATVAHSGGRLAAFLIGFTVLGLLAIPRAIRAINRLRRPEMTLVASMAICFAGAMMANELGYSVALGAFIAGSLIAESGEVEQLEHLVLPVRDLFAAMFFVSVGMIIDPLSLAEHGPAIAVLTLVVIAGKIASVSLGAFLTGNGTRLSLQAGMSLAQIGEFSFIIAGLGIATGATRGFLYPVAVAVSALTTITTPWLIRSAGPAAATLDRKLPRPLQTFSALYGTWIEELRSPAHAADAGAVAKRLVGRLLLDAALLAGLVIAAAEWNGDIESFAANRLGLSPSWARLVVLAAWITLAAPLVVGVVRLARGLGLALAQAALPSAAGGLDLAAAPRRALVVALQLGTLLAVGLPLLALTQPFLPEWIAAAALVVVPLLVVSFWRSARNLQGHVKAGAQLIAELLVAQAHKGAKPSGRDVFAEVKHLMPGLGEPTALVLEEGDPGVGQTLAQLNLRGLTGASVLAIARGQQGVIVPEATEVLQAGDVLVFAGTNEAVAAATAVLKGAAAETA